LLEMEEIQTELPAEGRNAGDVVPVRLQAAVSEVGTLELTAIPTAGGDERWKVAFNTRGNAG